MTQILCKLLKSTQLESNCIQLQYTKDCYNSEHTEWKYYAYAVI